MDRCCVLWTPNNIDVFPGQDDEIHDIIYKYELEPAIHAFIEHIENEYSIFVMLNKYTFIINSWCTKYRVVFTRKHIAQIIQLYSTRPFLVKNNVVVYV